MKVLLLGLGWFPDQSGGLNRYFRELFDRLREHGVTSRAVVIGPAADAGIDVAVACTAEDSLASRVRAFATAAGRLGKTAELVDVHFALYAFVPIVLGALRRKPLVVHFHGPWADESVSSGRCHPLTARAKQIVERAVYRRATVAVTLSGAFKRVLVESYGVEPWKVKVVSPGVDLDRFSPGDRLAARDELGLSSGSWVACSVRRLVPRMGLDVLLRAWGMLDGERVLLIAGEGPERARLEQMAARFGIADSVRFLGKVSEDELVSVYRSADVCVVPSTSLEGFGLVVLEALGCGIPVIASDVGGLPSALAGLEPRCTVPVGDAPALAQRLLEPLPSARACRATAERFSWDVCVRRHQDLYANTVRSPRSRKLRALYVHPTARLSRDGLALLRILRTLEDAEPHVILGEEGPLVARLLEYGISVEVFPPAPEVAALGRERVRAAMSVSSERLEARIYALRLSHRIRQLKPDRVHTDSLEGALYGALAGRLAGIAAVADVHDQLADDCLPAAEEMQVRP